MMTRTLEDALADLRGAVVWYQHVEGDDGDLARAERRVLVAAGRVAGASAVEAVA